MLVTILLKSNSEMHYLTGEICDLYKHHQTIFVMNIFVNIILFKRSIDTSVNQIPSVHEYSTIKQPELGNQTLVHVLPLIRYWYYALIKSLMYWRGCTICTDNFCRGTRYLTHNELQARKSCTEQGARCRTKTVRCTLYSFTQYIVLIK